MVGVHGGKARNTKVVVAAVFDAGGGRGVVKVIWVVAVPIVVWVVLEPADVVGVVALFDAGGGRVVVEVISVVPIPVVVWVVLEPADVIGVVAIFDARVGRGVVRHTYVNDMIAEMYQLNPSEVRIFDPLVQKQGEPPNASKTQGTPPGAQEARPAEKAATPVEITGRDKEGVRSLGMAPGG